MTSWDSGEVRLRLATPSGRRDETDAILISVASLGSIGLLGATSTTCKGR